MTNPGNEATAGRPGITEHQVLGRSVSTRLSRLILVFATTAAATFTILIAGGAGPQVLPVRIVYDVMAAVALITWLVFAAFRPSWRPSTTLAPAITVCLVVFAISTVTSRVPRLSIELLGYSVLLTGVYLLLVALMRRPETRDHLARLALILCVVVAGLYLVQVFRSWTEWWGLVGHLTVPPLRPEYLGLTLGSPNPLAAVVLMLGAFGLTANAFPGHRGRLVAGLIVILIAVTTFVTASRGAWAGAVAGIVAVAAAAVLVRSDTRGKAWRALHTRTGAAVAAAAAIAVVAAIGLAAVSGRLTLDDSGYREGFVAVSSRLISSAPLTGVGPGGWAVLRAAATDPSAPDGYVPHPHNIYLMTVSEFGILGIVAGVALLGALGLLIVRAIRSEDRQRRSVAYAAVFCVFVFAGQQVVDVLVNVLAVLLAVALPIAWLDAVAQPPIDDTAPPDSGGRRDRRATPLLLGAALLVGVIFIGIARVESATAAAQAGVDQANAGNWAGAAAEFGHAVAVDADVPLYQFGLGVTAANAGDLKTAERALTVSANADDYTYAWLNLAAVRWRLGDEAGARDALVRAERLGVQRPPVAVAAGWLRQQLGDGPESIRDYADAITLAPGLVDDPFWSSPAGPPGGLDAVLQSTLHAAAATRRQMAATRIQIALSSGRIDDAKATIAGFVLASERDLYTEVIDAWRGDAAAWADLQAATASKPLDQDTIGLARFVAIHLGDEAAINRYRRWLEIVRSSENALPIVGRIEMGQPEPIPAYLIDRYGSLYRRDIFVSQVVSLLPQIVWQDQE